MSVAFDAEKPTVHARHVAHGAEPHWLLSSYQTVAVSAMGAGPAERYYAGALYTGIALVVTAFLNIILFIISVRHRTFMCSLLPNFSHLHATRRG